MVSTRTVETLIWVLIYGGLIGACLGLFVERQNFALGWSFVVTGGIAAAAGALLIWVRSRMK
jgi:hypothetical protein